MSPPAYLASHLARLGLRPAGDHGTYLQSHCARPAANWTWRRPVSPSAHEPLPTATTSCRPDRPGTAEGAVVYIGNGTVIRSRGVDPYKDVDVAGKIVVSNVGLPAGSTQSDLKGPRGEDWEMHRGRRAAPRRRGGAVPARLRRARALARVARHTSHPHDAHRRRIRAGSEPVLPAATLSAQRRERPLRRTAGRRRRRPSSARLRREPAAPFACRRRRSYASRSRRPTTTSPPATSSRSSRAATPSLKDEYVAIGAHYDHLGTAAKPNAAGDTIYNGADDDGSGTVGILAMAEAFATAKVRPKRSILFVWHTGEEQGLWGSRYFTEHPTVPLDRIVAQLNIDMIGRAPAGSDVARHRVRCRLPIPTRSTWSDRRACRAISAASSNEVNAAAHGLHLDYSLDDPGRPGADLRAQRSLPVRETRHPHRFLLHRRARRLPRPRRRDRPHRLREDAPHRADDLRHGADGRRPPGSAQDRCARPVSGATR